MPAGARSASSGGTRQAPALLSANWPRERRLSRKPTSSGPATSSGATSAKRRAPSAPGASSASAIVASSESAKGPALSKNLRSAMGPSSVLRRPVLSRPIGAWGQRHFLETAVQPLQGLAGEVELRPHDDNSRLGQDEIKIVLAGDVLRDLQQNLLDLAHPLAEPLIEAAAQLLRLALQGFGVRLQLRPLLGIGLRRQRGAALGKVAVGRAQGLLTTLHLRLGPVAPRLDPARHHRNTAVQGQRV